MSFIALLGIDGCGKSTILNLMQEDLNFKDYHFLWVRWKPYFLRPLYKLVNKRKSPSIDQAELNSEYIRKASLKSKIFKSRLVKKIWLKLAYLDYKYTFKKKTKKLKKSGKIIFDRYYYDLFIDQGINFGLNNEQIYNLIKKYEKKFLHLDEVLYIRVTPEISFSRKNDIPNMEYLNKRFEIYEFLANKMKWQVINAEQELHDEYNYILKILKGE